jgi:hypothetical protein
MFAAIKIPCKIVVCIVFADGCPITDFSKVDVAIELVIFVVIRVPDAWRSAIHAIRQLHELCGGRDQEGIATDATSVK